MGAVITWEDMAEGDVQIFILKKTKDVTFKRERVQHEDGTVTKKKVKVPASGLIAGPICLVPIDDPNSSLDGRYSRKNFQHAMQSMMTKIGMILH